LGVSLSIFKDLSSPLYADDCQLYVSAPVDEASATVSRLSHCVTDVASNKQQVEKIDTREVAIHLSVITTVDSARDFGVTLDSHLNMSAHVSSMCRSVYHFLRQLRPVVRLLTDDAAKTVVHAFISIHLDYCNSLLCGISDTLLRRLQSVQNAAVRVITRTPRRDHITPTLHQCDNEWRSSLLF